MGEMEIKAWGAGRTLAALHGVVNSAVYLSSSARSLSCDAPQTVARPPLVPYLRCTLPPSERFVRYALPQSLPPSSRRTHSPPCYFSLYRSYRFSYQFHLQRYSSCCCCSFYPFLLYLLLLHPANVLQTGRALRGRRRGAQRREG